MMHVWPSGHAEVYMLTFVAIIITGKFAGWMGTIGAVDTSINIST